LAYGAGGVTAVLDVMRADTPRSVVNRAVFESPAWLALHDSLRERFGGRVDVDDGTRVAIVRLLQWELRPDPCPSGLRPVSQHIAS
jgi:hypothetical protein